MASVLSADSLSRYIIAALPSDASPQINNAFEAIALASHAAMLAVGFRLVGLGEEHKIEAPSDSARPQSLPAEWNSHSGSYSFRYAHGQSSMEFVVKVSRMGNKAVVMGMALGDDKTCSFDITARDYISEGNLPATPVAGNTSDQDSARRLVDVFISAGRLTDLGGLMRAKLIQKLAPGIHKEGYEEETEPAQSSRQREPPNRGPERQPTRDPLREDRDPPARPYPLHDPLAQPRRPMPDPMPGFEDEYEVQRPMRGGLPGGGYYPRIGDRDLYPAGLGPNDPIRGGIGPGFGGPMGGGGGMHPTFDDPLFAGQAHRDPGYDPQAPPGSRYDPVGPRMGGHPRGAGMGGRPPNPFGGFGDGDFI